MKKVLATILSFVVLMSAMSVGHAASPEATAAADNLYELGLFSGTGTGANGEPIYDLDRTPTRHEAVTMLVALLGKSEEAKAGVWETPFIDVADWAKPYVGYAYANGLTSGTSATTYGGNQAITATQYLTFVLTALGYKNGIDFQWDRAWELSDDLGITDGRYDATSLFERGDVVLISNNSLSATLKDKPTSLLDTLDLVAEPEVSGEDPVVQSKKETSGETMIPMDPDGLNYVLNINTMKFHHTGCSSVPDIKPENRVDISSNRDLLIAAGFSPCGRCHP